MDYSHLTTIRTRYIHIKFNFDDLRYAYGIIKKMDSEEESEKGSLSDNCESITTGESRSTYHILHILLYLLIIYHAIIAIMIVLIY